MIKLETSLGEIYGIGPRFLSKFQKLGIITIGDLVRHFPFRYEDYSMTVPIADLQPGQQATIAATVEKIDMRRSFKRKLTIVEAQLADETGIIKATWFNQPYIKNSLYPGKIFNFSGKIKEYGGETMMSSPAFEIRKEEGQTRHTGRLVPIYPETKGITSKGIRYIIQPILENLEEMPEWLPDEILDNNDLPDINESIRMVHFPTNLEEVDKAKRRFAWADLFLVAIAGLKFKSNLAKQKSFAIEGANKKIEELMNNLPFKLTKSQAKAFQEIREDLSKDTPMNRLLQGDVGSGKTAVAILAAMVVKWGGYQTALMAPTEVLARQHYKTIKKLAGREELSIAFISGGGKGKIWFGEELETDVSKVELKKKIEVGKVDIIIGTHALLQSDVKFKKLGLIIVDEQHRFGVEQRAKLTKQGGVVPHFLSMSATPIPRTLTLSVFGDLDLSVIDELPAGRQAITTKFVLPTKRKVAYEFIKKEIKAGRQAFVVCPRVEKPEDKAVGQAELFAWQVKSVKEEYEKLSEKIFPDLKVEMLHGKMKPKEKEEVMKKFSEGESDILVSTSVIEVGVDVPNATIMMIEGAERFGLAQLYQFRGRVGRGVHKSFCLLFSDSKTAGTEERLKAITEAKNGFELAEKDLAMRGPGQFLGRQQTGMPDTAMRSLHDVKVLQKVRNEAEKILEGDKELKNYPLLARKVENLNKKLHRE